MLTMMGHTKPFLDSRAGHVRWSLHGQRATPGRQHQAGEKRGLCRSDQFAALVHHRGNRCRVALSRPEAWRGRPG